MNEFVIPFLYKLVWATTALSLSGLTLNFLAKLLKAQSYSLMAISGFAPLVISVITLFVSWQFSIPPSDTRSHLVALAKAFELDAALQQAYEKPLDINEPAVVSGSPTEKTLATKSTSTTETKQSSNIPANAIMFALLALIWLAGFIRKIGIAIASYLRLCAHNRDDCTAADDRSRAEWHSLLKQYRCPHIPIIESSVLGPALCLLPIGYILVVPRNSWTQTSKENRDLALRHELSHYHRNHILLIAVCRAFATIHWFNPLAKACVARVELACEWQADDDATNGSEESAVQLAKSLVYFNSPQTAIPALSGAAELTSRECQLKNRVARLLGSNCEKEANMYKVSLMTAVFAVILASATARVTLDAAEIFPMDNSNASADTEGTNLTTNSGLTEPVQNFAAKETGRGIDNPYRKLFDEIAGRPNSPGFSLALLQQAFGKEFKQHANQLEIQLNSIKSVARTENGEWVTYEFDVDPLLFFHEIAYVATADKTVANEVLNGFLKDVNGPRIDMREMLKTDFQTRAKLTCRFIDDSRFERLLEIGIVDQTSFLPKIRKFCEHEPFAKAQNANFSHVVFQQTPDPAFAEFSNVEPVSDAYDPWAIAIHNQRLYWGTVELVEKAIKR